MIPNISSDGDKVKASKQLSVFSKQ